MVERMIRIESGIPLPMGQNGSIYPWGEMQVGDSFFCESDDDMSPMQRQNSAHSSVAHYRIINKLTNNQFGILTRRVKEDGKKGLRVWRVR